MRWLRAARRHGYALTAIVGGLGLGVVELARGYGLVSIGGAVLGAGFVYGALRVVGGLYRAGILRGPR